jgi:glutamate formiminotransferase
LFFLSAAFVGHPQAVIEAALAAGRTAYNLIDMTRHTGEHPRIGAMVSENIIIYRIRKLYIIYGSIQIRKEF